MKSISIHTKHDSNLTISSKNDIKLILELERWYDERYFESSYNPFIFEEQWKEVLEYAYDYTGFDEFDLAVTSWVTPTQKTVLESLIKAKKWVTTDHHVSHATLAYHTSNFKTPLILSYDGGGNDGTLSVFDIQNERVNLIDTKPINMGSSYRLLATMMPEITHGEVQHRKCGNFSLSGKLMGYAALGKVIAEWVSPLKNYYITYRSPEQSLCSLGKQLNIELEMGTTLQKDIARNLAASAQKAYEEVVLDIIGSFIWKSSYDGVIVTGGCALNVITNSRIKSRFWIQVHVPPNPNDSGISTGALWYHNPPANKNPITYKGLLAIDNLSEKNKKVLDSAKTADVDEIADKLLDGSIVGILRGRSEVGPRALGNRSIIAYPENKTLKDLINKNIKYREWFRPFAPVIPIDYSNFFLGEDVNSPYMSFSFLLRNDAMKRFPAVSHLDGTARVQTVSMEQNPWLYSLLKKINDKGGCPILLNTSFNVKGRPLITRYEDAFKILRETSLTHILIEDKLIPKDDLEN